MPVLFSDEGKVGQILRNYLSNALKFTEEGEIRVSAGIDAESMVVLQVRDTGIGIAIEDQQRLFQEFGQVPNRLQARVRGTGLGLSLSRRLAELLGGTVGVISTPGEGSTFWLRIPATLPGHAPAGETPIRPALDQAPLALIVDDEQAARYVLRRFLTRVGCRVIEASGGEDALFRAASDQPDVDLPRPADARHDGHRGAGPPQARTGHLGYSGRDLHVAGDEPCGGRTARESRRRDPEQGEDRGRKRRRGSPPRRPRGGSYRCPSEIAGTASQTPAAAIYFGALYGTLIARNGPGSAVPVRAFRRASAT